MQKIRTNMIGFILKLLFGDMEPGQIVKRRIFHKFDMAKNRVVIVVAGPLDAHTLAGAIDVLRGDAHARRYARKKTTLLKEDAA